MTSLRGFFLVLGITIFAGIGGLYALEELCCEKRERRSRQNETAQMQPIDKVRKESIEMYDKDVNADQQKREDKSGSGDAMEEEDEPGSTYNEESVIFDYHELSNGV